MSRKDTIFNNYHEINTIQSSQIFGRPIYVFFQIVQVGTKNVRLIKGTINYNIPAAYKLRSYAILLVETIII